ncbi:hypothetical protein VPH35_023366 [Triticum aestivum]
MVIVSSPEMEANAASLASLGAFLWLGGNRPTVNTTEIKEAISIQFGIERVTVVSHFPEDFFSLFEHPHHRDRVTASPGRFRHAGLDIHSSNWRPDAHSDVVQANYHVHMCIEGIPLNAWSDSVAAQVLGPDTFLHYFDIAMLRREDASRLKLCAWSDNPSAIPKVHRVTIAPRVQAGVGGAPSTTVGHRRILYGVVDGEEKARDDREPPPPPRRREDDDRHCKDGDRDRDDRRGRDNDRQRSSSWRGLFRSRSCAPERNGTDGRQGGHGADHGRDDRDRGRDGRRRACSLDRGSRGRSPPPSPRTTSSDVIHIRSSSIAVDCLRRAAPCFAPIPVQPSLTIDLPVATPELERSPSPSMVAVLEHVVSPPSSLGMATHDSLAPTPPLVAETELQFGTAGGDTLEDDVVTPIFVPSRPALLPSSPFSLPPRPPAARLKTLVGVTGFQLNRRSPRLHAKNCKLLVAAMAEKLLCQCMGIVDEGEQLTEAAITKFVHMFHGRLPDITIAVLRALFNLDCDLMSAVESALIEHGGEGGPELGSQEDVGASAAT